MTTYRAEDHFRYLGECIRMSEQNNPRQYPVVRAEIIDALVDSGNNLALVQYLQDSGVEVR